MYKTTYLFLIILLHFAIEFMSIVSVWWKYNPITGRRTTGTGDEDAPPPPSICIPCSTLLLSACRYHPLLLKTSFFTWLGHISQQLVDFHFQFHCQRDKEPLKLACLIQDKNSPERTLISYLG